MITVGIVALEILAYKVFVKLFPVLPNADKHGGTAAVVAGAEVSVETN